MNLFNTTEIDVGTVKPGQKKVVQFIANEALPRHALIPSCSRCTKGKYIEKNGQYIVEVTYKARPVPDHLKLLGWYSARPSIRVAFEDGTYVNLFIRAKVVK